MVSRRSVLSALAGLGVASAAESGTASSTTTRENTASKRMTTTPGFEQQSLRSRIGISHLAAVGGSEPDPAISFNASGDAGHEQLAKNARLYTDGEAGQWSQAQYAIRPSMWGTTHLRGAMVYRVGWNYYGDVGDLTQRYEIGLTDYADRSAKTSTGIAVFRPDQGDVLVNNNGTEYTKSVDYASVYDSGGYPELATILVDWDHTATAFWLYGDPTVREPDAIIARFPNFYRAFRAKMYGPGNADERLVVNLVKADWFESGAPTGLAVGWADN